MMTTATTALTDDTVGTITIGDLEVRRLGFGAMRITGPGAWGEPTDPQECRRVLRRVLELGVTLIDTADSYGPEVSERWIADVLQPYPDELVIATKGGLERTGPGQWPRNGRPDHLREACEGSLRRLGVEAIDLYQLHAPDPQVPYEESVGALRELQEAGKVRHVGVSNVEPHQLETAQSIVDVVSVQNRYNLIDQASEPVLERCTEEGIAFLPWFPLAAGELTDDDRPAELDRVADAHGASPAQIALAWLLDRSPVTVPIPGTSSVSHLEDNVAAAQIALSPDEVDRLDQLR